MRFLALLLAALAIGAALPATLTERDQRLLALTPELPAYGLSAWSSAFGAGEFDVIRRSGARYYRFDMATSYLDWDGDGRMTRHYDEFIREATARGVTLLPVLLRLSSAQQAEPPRTVAEHARWRTAIHFFAARYGNGGEFWRENPGLPYRPIRTWEVWNEPNLPQFWGERRPSPSRYRRLLAEGAAALRAADPEARVLSGGIAWRRDGARYLAAVLRGGGACLADGAAIHPYGDSAAQSIAYLGQARRILDRSGAHTAQLWPTEIGWRVGPRGRYAVATESDQARVLSRFAAEAQRQRRRLRLGPLFAFALRDRVDDGTLSNFGLRRADGSQRPAWRAWSDRARGGESVALPSARGCARSG